MIYVYIILCMIVLCPMIDKKVRNEIYRKHVFGFVWCIYLIAVLFFTLCRQPFETRMISLEPFRALKASFGMKYDLFTSIGYIFNSGWKSAKISVHPSAYQNAFLNILLFIPFGFLAKHRRASTARTLYLGFICSFGIEIVQYYTRLGCFELDDIWHNSIGTMLGVALSVSVQKCLDRMTVFTL